MIKFNCLIHKETGTVIKYEDWLENYKNNEVIEFVAMVKNDINFYSFDPSTTKVEHKKYNYVPVDIIFNDDFEIIYNSDFTLKELQIIFRGNQKFCDKLMQKICKNINDKEFIKSKYGIEV